MSGPLLTLTEVAEELAVSVQRVYSALSHSSVETTTRAGRLAIRESDLDALRREVDRD